MSRQERNQMLGYTNRSYTWTATTVRAGKRLVQVKMAHIRTNCSRICQSYLCIHICAVHIYLSAASVNDFTYFGNITFEDTVSGRISNHQSGKLILMLFCFLTEIFHIHITPFVAGTSQCFVASLNSRSRICSVCRSWDKNQVTMSLSDAFQIAADDAKSRIFSGSP